MRVHIGSDHAGFELKNHLVGVLASGGHDVVDHGAPSYDADDDYPTYCIPTAQAVAAEPDSLGIVIGGSGNGEQIAANKVDGVRAALVYDHDTAELGRKHNNANVMGIGARMHSLEEATELAQLFLATAFSQEQRHQRRIDLLTDFENSSRSS